VALAWIPLVVLTAMDGGNNLQALLSDYRVYARALIAIPLLLIAQVGMEQRFLEMGRYFLDANLVRAEDIVHFRRVMDKARRLRDAKLPEVVVVVAVYLQVGYFLESGRLTKSGWAVDVSTNALTPAGYYSVLVTQVLFMGLLGLVLWKWLIWILVMRDLSKMNLQLDPTDGDLSAGLGFLGEIPKAFTPVLLAISVVIGSAWRYQLLADQAGLKSLAMPAGLLAVIVVVIFISPLSLFTPLPGGIIPTRLPADVLAYARGETRTWCLWSNSAAIRSSPHVGFSRAILWISFCTSSRNRGLPRGLDFDRQSN
jgi:hypothetical protein